MAVPKRLLDWLAALAMAVGLVLGAPAGAQTFPEHGGSPVVDQAGLLRPEQALDLTTKAQALHAQTGRSFVVATVKSLEGLEVEDYATRLFRQWRIGDEKLDNGVLLLVAPNEKKVRIETGYGAEGFLPDILAGRIIRDTILPRFRAGDMAGGIMAGADAIIGQISLPADQAQANAAQAERQESARASEGAGFLPVLFILIVFFVVIRSMARRAGGRRYHSRHGRRGRGGIDPLILLWGLEALSHASRGRGRGWGGGFGGFGGGGGGFGGFGGFGGGSSGGGGASGSW